MSTDDAHISGVIADHLSDLAKPGVLSLRPGYEVSHGWLTGRRAIVATVDAKTPDLPHPVALPEEVEGVPVDVRQASPRKRQTLAHTAAAQAAAEASPSEGGLPLFPDEVTTAGKPVPMMAAAPLARSTKPQLPYAGPVGAQLQEVSDVTSIQVCASPDAGWPVLKAFLGATQETLTIGLYDFTSWHILDWCAQQLPGKTVALCLDHPAPNATRDQTDEVTVTVLSWFLQDTLTHAWALERGDPLASAWIFPSAYHIKVAVRDHATVWLSSGNWNNSNQPDIDPVNVPGDATAARSGDRDWHVVIESAALAATFEAFISNDMTIAGQHNVTAPAPGPPPAPAGPSPAPASPPPAHAGPPPATAGTPQASAASQAATTAPPFAQFFAPLSQQGGMRIMPLLTPDPGSYATQVKALIDSAQTTLYMQYQYIDLPAQPQAADAPFADLVAAVVARQTAGVAVKVIVSEFETSGYLEILQAAGLDVVNTVKVQNNVHNKGIVVDGSTVLVSSQNWSTPGTTTNRDAGVIISDPTIAQYFETIFLHDWDHLAAQTSLPD